MERIGSRINSVPKRDLEGRNEESSKSFSFGKNQVATSFHIRGHIEMRQVVTLDIGTAAQIGLKQISRCIVLPNVSAGDCQGIWIVSIVVEEGDVVSKLIEISSIKGKVLLGGLSGWDRHDLCMLNDQTARLAQQVGGIF